VTAMLLMLFAVGHTIGFLGFHGTTAESQMVRAQMDAVQFAARPGAAATLSFGKFYVGFGLFVTTFYVFSGWLAWRVGGMSQRGSQDAVAVGWAMAALMAVSAGLSVKYFAAPPVALSLVAVVTLSMGALAARRGVMQGRAVAEAGDN
jgi:hypothetical protein